MILKTKDYDMFVFRADNRQEINQSHVNRLIDSIQSRNLLEYRPIDVNQDMEIIDGQHRLLAAKKLNVEIYYQIKNDLKASDIIIMNVSKNWIMLDYLNFYCKNGYPDYIKLKEFMDKNKVNLHVVFNVLIGKTKQNYQDFKNGKYVFHEEITENAFSICWETLDYIKKIKGYQTFVTSARFWSAIVRLASNEEFDPKKWKINLTKLIDKVGPRVNLEAYYEMLKDIYNYKNKNKINSNNE